MKRSEYKFTLWLCTIILSILLSSQSLAEIRIIEVEVDEIVGRNQSQEQVEAFALQKAKRLAVEEAGTYISSLTIVKNYQLKKDEITALASGVVNAKIIGVPSIRVVKGVIHIKVRSRINVDTSVLDQQIEKIMQDKSMLKELERERLRVRELENKLATLKSSELIRLKELNAQAIALERQREKQRLLLAEQVLRAKTELKKAEIERLRKEREMQSRTNRVISEQEKARRAEAKALAKEQDRIRRAQLENEQRWKELLRKSQLVQTEWTSIDDSLSLEQAMEEVRQLKNEIGKLNQRIDFEYSENKKNLQRAFGKQIELTVPHLPPNPVEKDLFETTEEYQKRLDDHAEKVRTAQAQNQGEIEKLKEEMFITLESAHRDYLLQKIDLLEPFVKRLQSLQKKSFSLHEAMVRVTLGSPDADNSRFPLELKYKGHRWSSFWEYTDRKKARDLWKTKEYLRAQGFFQLEGDQPVQTRLTSCRVTHPGTGEFREIVLEKPLEFSEVKEWYGLLSNFMSTQGKFGAGDVVQLKHPYRRVFGKPTIFSDNIVEISNSTKLDVIKPSEVALSVWLLVMTPSKEKGWIKEDWVNGVEERKNLSPKLWDPDMKKYYRYDNLGNRNYE